MKTYVAGLAIALIGVACGQHTIHVEGDYFAFGSVCETQVTFFKEVGEQIAIVEADIKETSTEPGQPGCVVSGTYEVELPEAVSYEARVADWSVLQPVMQRSELEADGEWWIYATEVD